jgi:diguanylate cyclase (GGDEF)-like protein
MMSGLVAHYRLRLFTWIFLGFLAGSLVLALLMGLVVMHGTDDAAVLVAQRELLSAVTLAARNGPEPASQAAFRQETARYAQGLVLGATEPLTFTLVGPDGRIDYTTPPSLDGHAIARAALRYLRSAPSGATSIYLPLRGVRELLAWQKVQSGWLTALAPEEPLRQGVYANLISDAWYGLPLVLVVAVGTALLVGLLQSRSIRRLSSVRDEASADAVEERTHVREIADIARRWGDVLRIERNSAQSIARAFTWRDRLTTWLAAASAQSDRDLASLAQRIVDQLPFPIAQLSLADRQRNVSYPLAMRGYGSLTVRNLTQPLEPPTGLVSHAYHERRTINWPQDREMAAIGMPEQLDTKAAVAVPLVADGEVRGVLAVAVREVRDLPHEAVQSLEQVAPLLGTLIARQEALDRLRRQDRLFSWMRELNPILLGEPLHDPQRWWPQVARALRDIAGARAALLLQRGADAWQVAGSFGPGTPEQFAGTAVGEWARRVDEQPEQFRGWHEQGALCIGGVGEGDLRGVLLMLATPDAERVMLLRTIFEYLAVANEAAVRRAAVEDLARRDPLTGALNVRALEQRFADLVHGSPQSGFLFVLLDIDGFQGVNERGGRPAGDAALRSYGAHLRDRIGPADAVGRVGGDEFVLLLQRPAGAQPGEIGDLLEVAGDGTRLDASYGAVSVPEDAATFADAYRLADLRMCEMKRRRHGGDSIES